MFAWVGFHGLSCAGQRSGGRRRRRLGCTVTFVLLRSAFAKPYVKRVRVQSTLKNLCCNLCSLNRAYRKDVSPIVSFSRATLWEKSNKPMEFSNFLW